MIVVHAGHNPDGKVACGAVGYIKESTAARQIIQELKLLCPEIDIFSIEDGTSQQDVLQKTVTRIPSTADISISVHLNSSTSPNAYGVEAYVYNPYIDSISTRFARTWCEECADIGYKSRGVKNGSHLYVIKHVLPPAVLLECGFVSNQTECDRFDPKMFACTILNALRRSALLGRITDGEERYTVIAGSFTNKENAEKRLNIVQDIIPDSYIVRR